ncbi:MAG TPA: P27 family phage terminase small subunit [Patescibacteria group bacterium]|nr:P27 family phage terminase small subunit [Patescibacteria group bacterium]
MSDEEKKVKKEVKKIIKATIKNMESISIYRPEFDSTIKAYAEMRQQYDHLMIEFYESGCKITEEYTNNAGFTNIRKTATYIALESLRKEILNHENTLGLTPAGLKKINNTSTVKKKVSKLGKALSEIAQQ